MHQPYPPFQLECVTEIVSIVRRGAVREELKSFAKHAYTLQGAIQGAIIGEPDDIGPLIGSAQIDPDKLTEAHDALVEAQGQLQSFGAGETEAEAIDPETILLIVQLVAKLIEALRKRNG